MISRDWIVRPLYICTTVVETSVIRVEMGKDPAMGSGRTTRVFTLLGLGRWMGSVKGKGFLAYDGISPPDCMLMGLGFRDPLPCRKLEDLTWSIHLSLTPRSLLSSRCHSPLSTTSSSWGICNQEDFSSLVHHHRQFNCFCRCQSKSKITSPFPFSWGSQPSLYRALYSHDLKNLREICGLSKISFLVVICFDIFLFLMPICNCIMDPPPKKWHLT